MRAPTRQEMDDWFPTVIRYTGWALTIVLSFVSVFGYYVEAAPGFVAAGGMILYKTVHDAARSANGNGRKDPPTEAVDTERWSHLP